MPSLYQEYLSNDIRGIDGYSQSTTLSTADHPTPFMNLFIWQMTWIYGVPLVPFDMFQTCSPRHRMTDQLSQNLWIPY
jgi:hypothetical protein